MLQCQSHCQPCSYRCSSVSHTVNPEAMDAPVSVTQSTLQLQTLQCQSYCQPCSYRCSSVSLTVNRGAIGAPLSVTPSTMHHDPLDLWHHQVETSSVSLLQKLGIKDITAVLHPLEMVRTCTSCHNLYQICHRSSASRPQSRGKKGLERNGLNVSRLISVSVAWLGLTHKRCLESQCSGLPGAWLPGYETVSIQQCDQKPIMQGESHNELNHQIWYYQDYRFIYKCMETARTIRSQEMAGILGRVAKS